MDTRQWTLFVFLVALSMSIVSLCTPFKLKGVMIYFGSQGLWKATGDTQGYYTVTLALLLVSAVFLLIALVSYLILIKKLNIFSQLATILSQFLAGIFNIAAVSNFAVHEKQQEDGGGLETGFYLSTCSGVLLVINSVWLLFLPWMEDDLPRARTVVVERKTETKHV